MGDLVFYCVVSPARAILEKGGSISPQFYSLKFFLAIYIGLYSKQCRSLLKNFIFFIYVQNLAKTSR